MVVTIMLNALAALSLAREGNPFKLAACVYDIPVMQDLGRLDRWLAARAWRKLKHADIVWASDIHKARLARQFAGLADTPLVCHNCPTLDYLPEPQAQRDPWLRAELRRQGATLGTSGGSILLRAGAVGICGGLEQTLEAMRKLPEDYVFLMMGRPPQNYGRQLLALIGSLALERRAFLWERPSDEVWKRALQGADIGHLIHGPFPAGPMTRLYERNSSLSTNRLFQYMAAGQPIIAYDDSRMNGIYAEVPCFRVARVAQLGLDIHAAWCELGNNPDLSRQLGGVGRYAHQTRYNWESQFKPVIDCITNI
jgi:glycosyltransferase involved in cell wall biosynthesis